MRRTWTSRWKPGDKAPSFTAALHDGSLITSASLKDSRYILFFYNHDGSETCTREACNLRDHCHLLRQKGYIVIGVSEDTIKKHQRFILKHDLPYALISDEGNALAKIFDVYGPKEFMGRTSDAVHRTTFVLHEQNMIVSVIHPVDSAHHADQILTSLHPSS